MDLLLGGLAAVSAGFFTNPLEVVKTRMQMQGEMQKKGQYHVHYQNVVHAGYQIAKHDGILALQKGLLPALGIQFIMNGNRLGFYDFVAARGYVTDSEGNIILMKSVLIAGIGGVIGHIASNPLHIVRTQIQSQSVKQIAVGTQHDHINTVTALQNIYRKHGFAGLFRGAQAAIPRAYVASTAQLTSFTVVKQELNRYQYYANRPIQTSFISSMIGGIAISILACPLDLVMMRLYNQAVDGKGRGLIYSSYLDCVVKIYKSEGILAFYKGVGPMYMRLGPHTVLCLMFWDFYKHIYHSM